MKKRQVAAAVAGLLALCTSASAVLDNPVQLDAGLVTGASAGSPGISVFKGIPFAAPPVGALRWKAPQPAAHWTGTRTAGQFSGMCAQPLRTGAQAKLPTTPGLSDPTEDCLYLNVWTGAKGPSERRPVMVWLHGGGFTAGSGKATLFDGTALAKEGVVVVTVNYRLGPFGFFSHPELTRESGHQASGNYGLMDMIAALGWVQKNIAGFGGDPKLVTVFGQSAGGAAVADLMASPLAKGLFQRAIAESGGVGPRQMTALAEAEKQGEKAAASLGAKSLADLREKSMDEVLKTGPGSGPIVDGWVLREDPSAVFRKGMQNDVPLLLGSNADEGNNLANPVAAEVYRERVKSGFGDLAAAHSKLYPADSEDQAKASQITYLSDGIAYRTQQWARLQSGTGHAKAFLYYFTREAPKDGPFPGAYHDAEIFYVFRNQQLFDQQWQDADRALENVISSYWVNFALKGDPNGPGLPQWEPEAAKGSHRAMVFAEKAAMGPVRLSKAKLDLFEKVEAKQSAK